MTFSEVIKVRDGVFYNLDRHRARMDRTVTHHFGRGVALDLDSGMIPADLRMGLVKCRVVYGERVESVEFSPYTIRRTGRAWIVYDDTIDYAFKSTDRSRLDAFRRGAPGYDDVIVVRGGFVTDSSFANIVLELHDGALITPSTPLLAGTKRESLLERGVISEGRISPADLLSAAKIRLINAMIDLEDDVVLSIDKL